MGLEKIPLTLQEREFFTECVNEMLEQDGVQLMDCFIQHGQITCLTHCLAVASISYKVACRYKWNVDKKSLIRGALLHDYFLYDWHEKSDWHRLHGFTHPKRAMMNAIRDFNLNDIEKDIISKHMWPLTLVPPKYKESVLVNLIDNYCSFFETVYRRRKNLWDVQF